MANTIFPFPGIYASGGFCYQILLIFFCQRVFFCPTKYASYKNASKICQDKFASVLFCQYIVIIARGFFCQLFLLVCCASNFLPTAICQQLLPVCCSSGKTAPIKRGAIFCESDIYFMTTVVRYFIGVTAVCF